MPRLAKHPALPFALLPLALTNLIACGGSSGSGGSQPAQSPAPATAAAGANAEAAAPSFATTVSPILAASCSGSVCHSTGSAFLALAVDQSVFVANGTDAWNRITSTDSDTQMPPPGSGKTLSSTNQQVLITYLQSQGVTAPASATVPSSTTAVTSQDTTDTPPPSNTVTSLCAGVTADQKAAGLAMSFTDVDAIASANCGGGGCHTGAAPHGFVDNEATWSDATYTPGMLTDLSTGAMPIGGHTISADDKATIFAYICARNAI